MSEEIQQIPKQVSTVKSLFSTEGIKKRFEEMLGKKSQGFITSVLQIATNNELIAKADPMTVFNAAMMAATLDLPINQNLGFAYIVPYKGQAQFQLGWRGFVQLAQRSGTFKTINSVEVYENQIDKIDYLTGETTLKSVTPSGVVIGYIAYFKLLNGFEKSLYMDKKSMQAHAKKYSQSYKKGFGVWADGEDGFNAMGKKTVLKLLLSKYAPLSIEMQRAVIVDQSTINDIDTLDVTYSDNIKENEVINKEHERICLMIKDCVSIEDLELLQSSNPDIDIKLFETQKELLTKKHKK